jgi:DMSO/TMAO reductase YedYZ molybdopterin-dependent catalytic subunit
MSDEILLIVDGAVDSPLRLNFAALADFPEADQIRDVSRFHPTRKGDGVALDAILDRAGVSTGADHLTLHAHRDDFHVSVPLVPLRGQGIVVYCVGAGTLALEHGGPIRFLIRDLDDCANVKYLSRIELTRGRGRDTRPADEIAHKALHAGQTAGSTEAGLPPVGP